jgi:hypothetical protein
MWQKLTFLGPLVFVLATLHAIFAWSNRDLRAELEVLAPPPGALARTAAAAGDNQFMYRVWAFDLQNAGDTGGRATSMRNYNYDFVLGWLQTLRALDPRAHQHAFLAGNYFSLSQKKDDVHRIVAFLADDAARNPTEKWVWMVRAVEIAASRLKDTEYALVLSQRLAAFDVPSAPFSILILPAIFLEKLGRYEEARRVVESVLNDRAGAVEQTDLNWARDFLLQLPES